MVGGGCVCGDLGVLAMVMDFREITELSGKLSTCLEHKTWQARVIWQRKLFSWQRLMHR